MSDDFENRLGRYLRGELPPEEREEMERELEKLEIYQGLLEAELEENPRGSLQGKSQAPDNKSPGGPDPARVLSRAKWKARFQNAITAIGLVLVVTVICSGITSLFYSLGKPSRLETYRDVVRSTVAITEPNVMVRNTGMEIGTFFTLHLDGDMVKQVGRAESKLGELKTGFLLGQAGYPTWNWNTGRSMGATFMYPVGSNSGSGGDTKLQLSSLADWNRLEKLPAGTVAEAYLSLDQLYGTDEILKKLEGRDLLPLWFAVDTGVDQEEPERVIGFPYAPLWHYNDGEITQHTERKTGLFGRQVTETRHYPPVEEYGSGDIRDQNFVDTLKLLKAYESIAERIASGPPLQLAQRLDYVEANGVHIYGVVVTGPTEELLKFRDEPWVVGLRVGEVALWNWVER